MKILHLHPLGSPIKRDLGKEYEFVDDGITSPNLTNILSVLKRMEFDGVIIERHGFEEWCRELTQAELGNEFLLSLFGDVVVIAPNQGEATRIRTDDDFDEVDVAELDNLFGPWPE